MCGYGYGQVMAVAANVLNGRTVCPIANVSFW